jgi:ubiquinone/menaquinone biosynthesis C-methylase UbiE
VPVVVSSNLTAPTRQLTWFDQAGDEPAFLFAWERGMTDSNQFGRLDAWRNSADYNEAKAREQAERLEHRARADDEAAARDEYLQLIGLAPGERVLDIGCGSGVVTRAIAKRVAPDGRAVGADSSAALLAIAREHAARTQFAPLIEFREADCRKLPFADASFDVCLAVTVLAHVPGAERALAEMVRVTRRGGRVGVFDFDGEGLLIGHPDRHLTRRIIAAHCDQRAVNGHLIREIPAIFEELGLERVQIRGFMPLERKAESFYADLARRAGQGAVETGAITEGERTKWLAELEATVSSGRFIGGRLHLFVWGVRR